MSMFRVDGIQISTAEPPIYFIHLWI